MATVIAVGVWNGRRTHSTTWGPLTTTNAVGDGRVCPGLADKTVQCFGTFGVGATLSIEGSNDGTNWFVVNDSRGEGNPLTFTTAGGNDGKTILENPRFLRPNLAGGDGATSLTVIITASAQP